ncbi:MAG: hypothetical protein ACR2N5_02705, partial [Solirubrobacterales bacterium]
MKHIGHSHGRNEDARLLRGRGRYLDDVELPGQQHAAFVRSTEAHALVRSVDVSGALSRRGVSAALTADDLPASIKPAPSMWQPEGTEVLVPEWYPLASDRVACVGAPIAVVIAGDRYTAE